jgi:hypothetical protein
MSLEKLTYLHKEVQAIIDAMAVKEFRTANNKLVIISDELDDLLDTTADEDLLVELSKYQVLLNHLQIKLNAAE